MICMFIQCLDYFLLVDFNWLFSEVEVIVEEVVRVQVGWLFYLFFMYFDYDYIIVYECFCEDVSLIVLRVLLENLELDL